MSQGIRILRQAGLPKKSDAVFWVRKMKEFFMISLSIMFLAMALMMIATTIEIVEMSDWWQRRKIKKWWKNYDKNQWGSGDQTM